VILVVVELIHRLCVNSKKKKYEHWKLEDIQQF